MRDYGRYELTTTLTLTLSLKLKEREKIGVPSSGFLWYNDKMKRLINILFLLLVVLAGMGFAEPVYAVSMQDVVGGAVKGAINPNTIVSSMAPGSMGALLCSFRWEFCGKVTLVIVATAIFMIGLMTMTRKITWPYVILILSFTMILIKPEALVIAVVDGANVFNLLRDDEDKKSMRAMSLFARVCTCKMYEKTAGKIENLKDKIQEEVQSWADAV